MDSSDKVDVRPFPKSLVPWGRDEMNLAEFPITLLTDRVPKDQKQAIYQDEMYDERTGLTISRKLTISTTQDYGLTTPVDDEIILALIQLTRTKNGFKQRRVDFSRHELILLLDWPRTGASYERIRLSLQRWTSVFLEYENAWRDNRTKTWKSTGFHIIDKYELTDTRLTGDQLDLLPSYIVWGEDIFESFQAGYLKPLDFDLCMGLRLSTAKRMYRFLDKRFHHKSDWTFDLKELAHEHIGLGRHYEGPSHLKRNLLPAIQELENVDFLETLPIEERFLKDGRDWKVRLIQKRQASEQATAELPTPSHPLIAELIERGVTDDVAEALVQQHEAAKIDLQIQVFDWLREKKDKKVSLSPAGYLVKSITTGEKGYAIPKTFVPAKERKRRKEEQAAKDRKEAEDRRRQREQDDVERQERAKLNSYWESLTAGEQAALDEAAIAQADAETQKMIEPGPLRKYAMASVRHAYIRQLLKGRDTVGVSTLPFGPDESTD